MVRRVLPFLVPAVALAFVLGSLLGGTGDGVSAAIGALVVLLNVVANAYALSWAARTSPAFLGGVAALSFVVRMGVIFAAVAVLRNFPFFSTRAFILSVVPLTLVLLAIEMKALAGPMGRQIDIADEVAH